MKLGTPNFSPTRLREAREARGVTATSLAMLIGLTPSSISHYENGRQTPSPAALEAMAEKLRFPARFFTLPPRRTDDRPTFFRSLVKTSKSARITAGVRLRWTADLIDYLNRYLELPIFHFPDLGYGDDPLAVEQGAPATAATATRRFWNLGDGVISDLVLLLENNGVVFTRHRLYDRNEDALSRPLLDGNRDYVLLNSDKGLGTRSRFDAAHELGHLVLHRELDEQTRVAHHKLVERQANRFAGALLMPADTFGSAFVTPELDVFAQMKPRWKVSVRAMMYRSYELGILNRSAYESLERSYRRRGWHIQGEPYDDKIQAERPRLLRRSVETLIGCELQTRADVVAGLSLPTDEVEQIADLPSGYLTNDPAAIIRLENLQRQYGPHRLNADGPATIVEMSREGDRPAVR